MRNTLLCAKIGGVSAVAALLLLAGCGKQTEPVVEPSLTTDEAAAADNVPQEEPVARILQQADEFMMRGATNEALAVLEAGLEDPSMREERQHLFNGLIRFLLFTDQEDKARTRMLDAYQNDTSLAVGGLGLIYGYLRETGSMTNVLGWTETVLAIPELPKEVRRSMREWNLLGYVAEKNDARTLEITAKLIREAPGGSAIDLLSRAIDALFNQNRPQAVEKIVAQMEKVITSDPGTQNLKHYTRVRLMAVQGEWGALQKTFPDVAEKLPDAELQGLLRQIFSMAERAGKSEVVESLSLHVIEQQSAKRHSFTFAGGQWVAKTMPRDSAALPARLERLHQADFPVNNLCRLYVRYFYDVIDEPVTIEAMKQLGSRLVPLAEDDQTRNTLRTMVLDASFVLEDYATALTILEAGIAGRDPAWHAMAISKVKAHKALLEKRPQDAVKHFREFMATVATAEEENASDPATGIIHTREMILGRNAKRIGDIFKGMQPPEKENASKAYSEARDYYQKALENEEDPAAIALIEKELSTVP